MDSHFLCDLNKGLNLSGRPLLHLKTGWPDSTWECQARGTVAVTEDGTHGEALRTRRRPFRVDRGLGQERDGLTGPRFTEIKA